MADEKEEGGDDLSLTSITLPSFKRWSTRALYDYLEDVNDYSSFEELEKVFTRLRKALFLINDKLNEYERLERLAKVEYDRAWRREYLTSTAKTEGSKKARADLACEELENEWLMNEQLKSELTRTAFTLKSEMQTLTTLAHNMRAQMKNL